MAAYGEFEPERLAQLALDATAVAIGILDLRGRWTWVNRACVRLLGHTEPAELLGASFPEPSHPQPSDEGVSPVAECPILQALRLGERRHRDAESFARADGSHFPVEYWLEPLVRDGSAIGAVLTFLDISNRRSAEARVRHLAYFDALTDLPNRILFQDRLAQALARCRRQDRFLAVHLLDLDHFKAVNDTHGHAVGDALLRAVADRLRGSVRATDTVARLGGDEFVILQADLPDLAGATTLAYRLVRLMTQPFRIAPRPIPTTVSLGIAVYPHDGLCADALLRNADQALYHAKAQGRNTYRFFTPAPDRDS